MIVSDLSARHRGSICRENWPVASAPSRERRKIRRVNDIAVQVSMTQVEPVIKDRHDDPHIAFSDLPRRFDADALYRSAYRSRASPVKMPLPICKLTVTVRLHQKIRFAIM